MSDEHIHLLWASSPCEDCKRRESRLREAERALGVGEESTRYWNSRAVTESARADALTAERDRLQREVDALKSYQAEDEAERDRYIEMEMAWDKLVFERDRLREALERIRDHTNERDVSTANPSTATEDEMRDLARETLGGTSE